MAYNCLIMGAAGRDFHDFQMFFRDNPQFRVQGFTATQIPFIAERSFPRELAGPAYDADIPIFPEERLPELIERFEIDFVFLAYSDLAHADVMHKASLVQACGAAFALLGPKQTQLASTRPVIAVTAVRTGAGKSPITQFLARTLADSGRRVGVLRHPMPYGDLARQAVERFATLEDLDRYECTVEEREEYEPYVAAGQVIFAGVDYRRILAAAEPESDVILWDGGNNDYAFVRPGLSIVVADALRAGHEVAYYPGETNFRAADVVVINKVSQADAADVKRIRASLAQLNPRAQVVESDLEILVDSPELIAGRRVLVVEDGPTLTHGGMSYGAGWFAARRAGAAEIVSAKPWAVGTIKETYEKFPNAGKILPAMGYGDAQIRELEETINATPVDVVVEGTPIQLSRVINVNKPIVDVTYELEEIEPGVIEQAVRAAVGG